MTATEAGRELILVRHAEPRIEPARPASVWELSPGGREAARALGDRLSARQPGACFSSPEPKAFQTAEAIASVAGLVVEPRDAFREHDRDGVPFFEEPDAFRRAVLEAFDRPDARVLGNESADEAASRFGRGVDAAMITSEARAVVVVAHGTVLSLYAAPRLGQAASELWTSLRFGAWLVLPWTGPGSEDVVEPIELHPRG